MKCPKCHYLSFDPEPRCRNCGYTLALDPDLAIHPAPEADAPLVDLTLRDSGGSPGALSLEAPPAPTPRRAAATHAEPTRRARTTSPGPFDPAPDEPAPERADANADPDLFASAPPTGAQPAAPGRPAPERARRQPLPPPTTELPLFVKGIGIDAVQPPTEADGADVNTDAEVSVPAAGAPLPMSARRATAAQPARAHVAEGPRLGPLDRDLLDGLRRIEHAEQRRAAADAQRAHDAHRVGAGRRLGAAAIDAAFLGALATAIVSVTLRWTDLTWSQLQTLPLVPLLAFLLLVATAYLFMFTAASGQTAGKMLMGTRVVDAGQPGTEQHRVSVRQALCRGVLTVPSVLLLGAGFLPALGRDERAIHDRLTHTRVVRV